MNLTSHDYNNDVGVVDVVDAVAAPHPAHSKSTIPRPSSSLDMTNFGLHLAMELLGPARVMEHIELHQRFAPFETRIPPRLVYIPPLYWRSWLFIPKELATDKTTPPPAANAKEHRGLWLWQALMNQPGQHSDGSTSLDCTVKHSLLYFDITFKVHQEECYGSVGFTIRNINNDGLYRCFYRALLRSLHWREWLSGDFWCWVFYDVPTSFFQSRKSSQVDEVWY
jgi:hypothetical protein